MPAARSQICSFIWIGFLGIFSHLVMDREADEPVVGGENISGDQIGSNSGGIATTTRQASSIPVGKKRYKKLGIAKSVLHYLI